MAMPGAGGVLGWDQAEVAHELARGGEAREIAQFGDDSHRVNRRDPAQRLQRLEHRAPAPGLEFDGNRLGEIAWKAQLRLCTRYRRLAARGLHKNKIVVAIARELSGFVWAIAREVKPAA